MSPRSATLAVATARAQRRTIDVALELFADHGVGGTSLQMIADALGVTKAAVYHQFRTKDEIVLAVPRSTWPARGGARRAEAAGGTLEATRSSSSQR